MKQISIVVSLLIFAVTSFAQRELGVRPTDTGGPLVFEQAAFDVQTYDISLKVDPKAKSISGTTVMTAKIVIQTNVIVLDLDTPYKIDSIYSEANERQAALKYERREGKIWIWFPMTKQPG